MPTFAFSDWQAQQLRLTIFPVASDLLRDPLWWTAATGVEPDETTTNPKKGTGLVQGDLDRGKLILRLEPERIDWILTPRDPADLEPLTEIPNLGPAMEAIQHFCQIADRWITSARIPTVTRIAFGAALIHPESDKGAAYERLEAYLPITLPRNASDFSFQVNLPVSEDTAGVKGLSVNRLSRWSAGALKGFSIPLQSGVPVNEVHPPLSAIRAELDINTVPAFTSEIPRERLAEVFKKLVGHAASIVERGLRVDAD